MPTDFYAYQPPDETEWAGLLNNGSKYGATYQANASSSAQNLKSSKKKCRFSVIAIFFGVFGLIVLIVLLLSHQKKPINIKTSSFSIANAHTEPQSESTQEEGDTEDEIHSEHEQEKYLEGEDDEQSSESWTGDDFEENLEKELQSFKAAKLYEEYVRNMLAAGKQLEKILSNTYLDAEKIVQAKIQILEDWHRYIILRDRATESLHRFEDYISDHTHHQNETAEEPAATSPAVKPAESTPVVEPAAPIPPVQPAALTPVVEPAASTPVAEPAASTPSDEPASSIPAVNPAATIPLIVPPEVPAPASEEPAVAVAEMTMVQLNRKKEGIQDRGSSSPPGWTTYLNNSFVRYIPLLRADERGNMKFGNPGNVKFLSLGGNDAWSNVTSDGTFYPGPAACSSSNGSGPNMGCCMNMLCGSIVAGLMQSNISFSSMTQGFECLNTGNVTSCFGGIPEADPLMNCLMCHGCLPRSSDLIC